MSMEFAKDIFISPKALNPFMTDFIEIRANRHGTIHQWTVLACPFQDVDQDPADEYGTSSRSRRMLFVVRKGDLDVDGRRLEIGDEIAWDGRRWGVWETVNDSATITVKARQKVVGC